MSDPLVLIVDDYPVVTRMITYGLRDAGFRTDVVANGAQALAYIKARRECDEPALLLTNITTSRVGGWALIRHLRSERTCWPHPIVVLTDLAEPHLMAMARRSGVHHVLLKPINYYELVTTVRSALRQTVCEAAAEQSKERRALYEHRDASGVNSPAAPPPNRLNRQLTQRADDSQRAPS